MLLNQAKSPILLAGPSWMQDLFSKFAGHKKTFATAIGKRHPINDVRVLEQTTQNFHAFFEDQLAKQVSEEFDLKKTSHEVLKDFTQLFQAAKEKKVKTLVIATDENCWGTVKQDEVILHPHQMNTHDDDLLDDLAETVLENGGNVLCLPKAKIPEHLPALAFV